MSLSLSSSRPQHYGHSEVVTVDVRDGAVRRIGPPRMYTGLDASPDGRYLLVSWLERPLSFDLPCGRFPKRVQLWRAEDGGLVRGGLVGGRCGRAWGRVGGVCEGMGSGPYQGGMVHNEWKH